MIGYTCKYTPTEIFAGFDEECVLLNQAADDFDYAQRILHPNMCSHVKAIIEDIHSQGVESFIFVNCCDSLRRAYDAEQGLMSGFVFFMDLPHESSECSVERFKGELCRLVRAYEEYSGKTFDLQKFKAAFAAEEEEAPEEYVAILGGRCEDDLLKKMKEIATVKLKDLTCGSSRRVGRCPDGPETVDEVMEWYAAELLAQMPCMRMQDIGNRRSLLEDPNLAGVIYHTVKFCDYYDFEFRNIRQQSNLPMIKIETDYTSQAFGQLSTRLEAFFETLELKRVKAASAPAATATDGTSANVAAPEKKYFAGLDSGSTTTNFAVIDRDGKVIHSSIVRTGVSALTGARKAVDESGADLQEVCRLAATGYGRKSITFADEDITEITCHARGAHFLCPSARTVIDIGGQDSKVIVLDEAGEVTNFIMNDKCAAGTGRFLENMARVLEMSMEKMAQRGLTYEENLTISSMCTVFAESEVVSLIAENKSIDDIIHALNKSVAVKISSLIDRAKARDLDGDVIMTGGVGRNPGVVREIEKQIGKKIFVPEMPDLCGAIGAALMAMDR